MKVETKAVKRFWNLRMSKASILLVEDDDILGASISDLLHIEGYHVDWITDGLKGLEAAKKEIHDLVILDVMLPKMNGFQVLENLRKSSQVPVLVLSAKSEPENRIHGLKLKADDYLGKPFHLEELILRVSGLIRRAKQKDSKAKSIEIAGALIDFEKRSIKLSSGTEEKLGEKEADILKLLVSNEGKILSRDEILDSVWGSGEFPTPRTVDNFILKIRKWIEPDHQNPQYIMSQRGVGYGLKLNKEEQ